MDTQEFTILYEMTKDIKLNVEGLNAKIDQAIIDNAKQDGRLTALEDRVKERSQFINVVLGALLAGIVTLFVESFSFGSHPPTTEVGMYTTTPLRQIQ